MMIWRTNMERTKDALDEYLVRTTDTEQYRKDEAWDERHMLKDTSKPLLRGNSSNTTENDDQRDCKLMHPMHDDDAAARREELAFLARIGSRGAPRFAVVDVASSAKPATYQANQVVHDMLHQLRVQMEPRFVQGFIASLTPASRDWIKANEDQAQTKVAEVLKASGMSLDQLRALLDSVAEK